MQKPFLFLFFKPKNVILLKKHLKLVFKQPSPVMGGSETLQNLPLLFKDDNTAPAPAHSLPAGLSLLFSNFLYPFFLHCGNFEFMNSVFISKADNTQKLNPRLSTQIVDIKFLTKFLLRQTWIFKPSNSGQRTWQNTQLRNTRSLII